MKRAVLLLLATMGLMPAAGSAEAASPLNGEALFNANCARCHDRALPRMPSRAGLKEKDARDVFTTISAGVMAPYPRQLSHDERRAVAEYAADMTEINKDGTQIYKNLNFDKIEEYAEVAKGVRA